MYKVSYGKFIRFFLLIVFLMTYGLPNVSAPTPMRFQQG